MKKRRPGAGLIFFMLLFFGISVLEAIEVTNVRARQRNLSRLVDVFFDLEGDTNLEAYIRLRGSSDNGYTWNIKTVTVTGDTGIVGVGSKKHIVWNAEKDYPGAFSTMLRLQIEIRAKLCPRNDDAGMAFLDKEAHPVDKKKRFLKPFCIDRWEFPNVRGEKPLTLVNYRQARAHCKKAGKTLCTAAQWEAACVGRKSQVYPYGKAYAKTKCNTEGKGPNPIGQNRWCVTKTGVYDLSGNVYEWVSAPQNDIGGRGGGAIGGGGGISKQGIRGGNWNLGEKYGKCALAQSEYGHYATEHTGFRCCFNFSKDRSRYKARN